MSQRVQRAYSRLAQQYIGLFGSLEQVHPGDLELIGRSMAEPSGPVLDLGCGPGHLAGFLRSLHADVTGIDLVPEFVAHARAAHPGVRFEVGFEHKVVRAYRWQMEEMARRLVAAGFVEIERLHRAQDGERRPYAAIAARAA